MQQQGVVPNKISCGALIFACTSRQREVTLAVFNEVTAGGLDLDVSSYSILCVEFQQSGLFYAEVAVLLSLKKVRSGDTPAAQPYWAAVELAVAACFLAGVKVDVAPVAMVALELELLAGDALELHGGCGP